MGAFPPGLAYVAYGVYRAPNTLPREHRPELATEALRTLAASRGVALRGTYDVSGYRADANVLVWLAGPSPDLLQDALAGFRQTALGHALHPFWTAIGVHRDAEIAKGGVPAYFRGDGARRYLCVCPAAYTPEWYQLESHERRRLLLDSGRALRDHPDVRANTVVAFGLGDRERLAAYESDQLTEIVDMMRSLKSAEMQRYTLNEDLVITGVRKPLAELLDALP